MTLVKYLTGDLKGQTVLVYDTVARHLEKTGMAEILRVYKDKPEMIKK